MAPSRRCAPRRTCAGHELLAFCLVAAPWRSHSSCAAARTSLPRSSLRNDNAYFTKGPTRDQAATRVPLSLRQATPAGLPSSRESGPLPNRDQHLFATCSFWICKVLDAVTSFFRQGRGFPANRFCTNRGRRIAEQALVTALNTLLLIYLLAQLTLGARVLLL